MIPRKKLLPWGTLGKVAKEAGVSSLAVTRYLEGGRVRAGTASRVATGLRALGFDTFVRQDLTSGGA